MAVANQPALPPGASLEGVGRVGRCARVLCNSADRLRKKLITKLNDLFYVFTSYSTSNAPKTMELCFPCASCSLHLPSILPSVAAASFWLVVAFKIINRRPFKAAVYFIFYIFVDQDGEAGGDRRRRTRGWHNERTERGNTTTSWARVSSMIQFLSCDTNYVN